MTVSVEASEIAVKDYSPIYGTVTGVKENKDARTGSTVSYDFTFFNGTVLSGVEPDRLFDIVGGGLTDHGPIGSIRPGLEADHANDK